MFNVLYCLLLVYGDGIENKKQTFNSQWIVLLNEKENDMFKKIQNNPKTPFYFMLNFASMQSIFYLSLMYFQTAHEAHT